MRNFSLDAIMVVKIWMVDRRNILNLVKAKQNFILFVCRVRRTGYYPSLQIMNRLYENTCTIECKNIAAAY